MVKCTASRPSRASQTALGDRRPDVLDPDPVAQFGGDRCHAGVADTARDDRLERAEVAVAVEREPVQRRRPRHPHADGGDFARRSAPAGRHPHSGAAVDAAYLQTHVGAHLDQRFLDAPNVIDHIERLGQPDDRVADQLARPVPGDLAAAVGVDDRVCRRSAARAAPCAGRRYRPTGVRAGATCRCPPAARASASSRCSCQATR